MWGRERENNQAPGRDEATRRVPLCTIFGCGSR